MALPVKVIGLKKKVAQTREFTQGCYLVENVFITIKGGLK